MRNYRNRNVDFDSMMKMPKMTKKKMNSNKVRKKRKIITISWLKKTTNRNRVRTLPRRLELKIRKIVKRSNQIIKTKITLETH